MALHRPSREELRQFARHNHFALSNEETESCEAMLPAIFTFLDALEELPEPTAPPRYPSREVGQRPTPSRDPLNAIVRRCNVAGAPQGPLAGKRVGLKDNICVAGIPLTCGSHILQDFVPQADATIVGRMLDAGAQIVAKLNMDNLAFSPAGDTSAYGPTLNPHDPRHLAGGSSGGSAAALYYDEVDLTIGSDQGGSIRIPAAWCGVVGLKPTYGLVPYTGIVSVDPTLDHAGPLARSVAEVALAMDVLAGKDPGDPRQSDVPVHPCQAALGRGLRGIRIGVLEEGFGQPGAEPDVEEAVRAAIDTLGELGASVSKVSLPAHRTARVIYRGLLTEGFTAMMHGNGMGYHWRGTYDPALATAFGTGLQTNGNALPLTVKLQLLVGTYLRQHHYGRLYAKAQNLRGGLRAGYDSLLRDVDVLAMPTTPIKAVTHVPSLDLQTQWARIAPAPANTVPFDITGHPSLSVPCARSQGLPVGLMLTGRHFEEATLLAVAHAFEQHVDWKKRT